MYPRGGGVQAARTLRRGAPSLGRGGRDGAGVPGKLRSGERPISYLGNCVTGISTRLGTRQFV